MNYSPKDTQAVEGFLKNIKTSTPLELAFDQYKASEQYKHRLESYSFENEEQEEDLSDNEEEEINAISNKKQRKEAEQENQISDEEM